jgi:hypothetical protein
MISADEHTGTEQTPETSGPAGLETQAEAYRIELAQTFRALQQISGDVAAAFETGADGAVVANTINVFERLRLHAGNNLTSLWAVASSQGSA